MSTGWSVSRLIDSLLTRGRLLSRHHFHPIVYTHDTQLQDTPTGLQVPGSFVYADSLKEIPARWLSTCQIPAHLSQQQKNFLGEDACLILPRPKTKRHSSHKLYLDPSVTVLCHCLTVSLDRTFIAFLFTSVYGKLSEGIFGSFLYILFCSQSIFVWLLHASLRVSVLLISIAVICRQGGKVTEPPWIPASPSPKWTYICKYSEYSSESRK